MDQDPIITFWWEDATLTCRCGHETRGVNDAYEEHWSSNDAQMVTCESCGAQYILRIMVVSIIQAESLEITPNDSNAEKVNRTVLQEALDK